MESSVIVPDYFTMDEGRMYSQDFEFTAGEAVINSVVEAQYTKLNRLNQSVRVRGYGTQSNFFSEVNVLKTLIHPSIEKMLGYVVEPSRLLLITDYYAFSDLQTYCSLNNVTERNKVLFGAQVCEGLKYIVEKGCLHHAIVLSNVLVKTATICVISSFGVTRASAGTTTDKLIFTYPPELLNAILLHKPPTFTPASCVWSYGVLLWQLFSTEPGEDVQPYSTLQADSPTFLPALVEYLTQHRLSLDAAWPAAHVITQCWSNDRPSFQQIAIMLTADI